MTLLGSLSAPCLELAFCGSLSEEASLGCFTGELSGVMLVCSAGFLEFTALHTVLLSLLLSEMAFWEEPELTCLVVLERFALTRSVSLQLALAVFTWLGFVAAHTVLAFALV